MSSIQKSRAGVTRPTSLSACWSSATPERLTITTHSADGTERTEERCPDPARWLGLGTRPELNVRMGEFGFYEPELKAELREARFRWAPAVPVADGLAYRLQLWASLGALPEPAEAIFAGQKGFLRLVLENGSATALQIEGAAVASDSSLRVGAVRGCSCVAAGSQGELVFPIEAPLDAKAALHSLKLRFTALGAGGQRTPVEASFDVLLYRLRDSRCRVLHETLRPGFAELDFMVEAEAPLGVTERVEWRQSIEFHTSEPQLSLRTEVTSMRATVQLPARVSKALLASWGAPMSPALLSGLTILAATDAPGGWGRRAFGWLTGGLAGAFAGMSAVALKTLLVTLISAIASPAWGIVVAVIIGRPVFEAFLGGFLAGAAGAAGYDINLALWDKIAEVFSDDPPAQ